MTPAPDRKRLAGLTFATVDEKMEAVAVGTPCASLRTNSDRAPRQRHLSLLLLATVISLWIYFR